MKRPLLLPIISFLLGVLAAGTSLLPSIAGFTSALITACIGFLLLAFLIRNNEKAFIFSICLFFFFLGVFRYETSVTPRDNDISAYCTDEYRDVTVYGTVTSSPERKSSSYGRKLLFPLRCHSERPAEGGESRNLTGTTLVSLYDPETRPRLGDQLVITGKIALPKGKTNPAGFDYRAYLSRKGITALMRASGKEPFIVTGTTGNPLILIKRKIADAREKADHIIRKYLKGVSEAITESAVLGIRGGIPDSVEDAFIKTGTMHILAVSGLHVGVVAMVILGLLSLFRCPRNLKYFLAILGICAFAVFTGSRASTVRAAIMGSFVLFSLSLERKPDILIALAFSAFLITFFQPGQLFDAGFILSYTAVLSIIYITPLTDTLFGVKPRSFREKRPETVKRWFLKPISLSVAVWTGMIPVIAYYFRIISPSVIIANLVAIPALFLIVVSGFGLILSGSIAFLAPASLLLSGLMNTAIPLFIGILEAFSRVPGSYVRVPSPSWWVIAVYYVSLIAVIASGKGDCPRRGLSPSGEAVIPSEAAKHHQTVIPSEAAKRPSRGISLLIFLLLASNLFVWNEALIRPPGSTRTTFFDVGKADASLMEFPDGTILLIDGGEGGRETGLDAGRDVLAPYFWQKGIRKIDCVLLTHADSDHIGGLPYILRNFKAGTVIDGGYGFERPIYRNFRDIIKRRQITREEVTRGDIVKGLPETDLFILNPPEELSGDANNDSIVFRTGTDEGPAMLFCADVTSQPMAEMLRCPTLLDADVIKIPHHGMGLGDMVIFKAFIDEVSPKYAIIPNTPNKVNKHILKFLEDQGTVVYITGKTGAVTLE